MPGTAIDDGYTHYDHSFPINMNRYVHLFPANPYGTPPQLPVQQSVAHKVWIIDCRSCGSFLTNRGMKAVLLLRPNVPLYSCDALPQNCSAFTHSVDDLKPPSESRSCNCLSQTLSCVGCGTTVGYMIVIPCVRCTSSISANNRATNGHRFVFHSSEVVGTERHYVPGEPGVIPFESVPVTMSPPPSSHAHLLPTPPLDTADLSPVSPSSASPVAINSSSPYHSHHLPPGLRFSPERFPLSPPLFDRSPVQESGRLGDSSPGPPPLMSISSRFAFGMPVEQVEQPLKAGDILFWHHLIRHGEIAVFDDKRARTSIPKSAVFGR